MADVSDARQVRRPSSLARENAKCLMDAYGLEPLERRRDHILGRLRKCEGSTSLSVIDPAPSSRAPHRRSARRVTKQPTVRAPFIAGASVAGAWPALAGVSIADLGGPFGAAHIAIGSFRPIAGASS